MPPALPPSPAFQALAAHRDALGAATAASHWQSDPGRGEALTVACAGLAIDFSKQNLTAATMALLVGLAKECGVHASIAALFAGEHLNRSEDRPALHMALRGDEHVSLGGEDVRPGIQRTRERLRSFAGAVREGHWKGTTGERIRHVVALGIGGSSLGPRLACEALCGLADGPEVRFVANLDPAALDDALRGLDPAATLVVVASKTFTTEETLANAVAARDWLVAGLGEGALARHCVAATAAPGEAIRFGLPECNVFTFGDYVGGRYSLWSSVGLPVALALGANEFEKLLAGAHAVDIDFRSSPLERNAPVLMALVGLWNRNVLGIGNHAVLPYAARLATLPAYLQQLEMESGGKRVDRDGRSLGYPTAPAVWGGAGTEGQHAFHQWLHQGTDPVACDFVVVARPMGSRPEAHARLLANAAAQSEALMNGVATPEPHRDCPGGRPSTTIVLPALDAHALGSLIALYEHKVFVQACAWNTNPFDQWGVELGKRIAARILPALGGESVPGDPATRHLLGLLAKSGAAA